MAKDWAHARHVRTRSADSTRPQRRARVLDHRQLSSGRMNGDWFGLPQRRVGHEGLEVAAPGPHLAQPRTPYLNPAQSRIGVAYRVVVCP